ncbi:DDE-type integrase/transposase/recombinase [Streptomyces sp. NPDC008121]|uniref:DDE-type integrase/transposase/recombinase n=1 Tax=Streptomyces sp. NPDC008121 TaxID=3364809 RepID=UPI0036E75F6A
MPAQAEAVQPDQGRPADSRARPVGRNFTADNPGEKLVGDITYIPTGQSWIFLATVIDCRTREVVGYAMDDHYRTALISRAINNAARNRELAKKAIVHSDRGGNYMSAEYGKTLDRSSLRRSAGRTGICYDNAIGRTVLRCPEE